MIRVFATTVNERMNRDELMEEKQRYLSPWSKCTLIRIIAERWQRQSESRFEWNLFLLILTIKHMILTTTEYAGLSNKTKQNIPPHHTIQISFDFPVMDQPGFSLFQGTESIFVEGLDNDGGEEEAEDIIDAKRRENELGLELQNAFDDLLPDDDDDETMDNSYRSGTSFQTETNRYGFKRNYLHEDDDADQENDEDETGRQAANENTIYRLQMQLQSKTNELEHVNKVRSRKKQKLSTFRTFPFPFELLTDERQSSQRTISDLQKQLAVAVAEGERAQMQKNQTHELLVESKAHISELDAAMVKLKDRHQALEVDKSQLTVDLENARIQLNDAEMKCRMMQKEMGRAGSHGATMNHSAQDAAFKQLAERNAGQVEMMQQQIDNFRNKLEARDIELRTMEAKYREVQKTREVLMIEKTETINQLTEQLERTQRQCQDLLAAQSLEKSSTRTDAENSKLRVKVANLEQHIDDLQKTTDGLLKELDGRQRTDFANVMESTPHLRKKPHLAMQGLEETDVLVKQVEALKQELDEKVTEIKNLIMIEDELRKRLRAVEEEKAATKASVGCGDCRVKQTELDDVIQSNCDLQEVNQRIVSTQQQDNRLVVEKLRELQVLQKLIAEQSRRIADLEAEKAEMEKGFAVERQQIREMSAQSLDCMQKMKQATEIEVKNMQLQTDCMDYLKNLRGLRAASTLLDVVGAHRDQSTTTTSPPRTYCDRSVMVSTPRDLCSVASQTQTETETSSTVSTLRERSGDIIEEYAKLSALEIKRVEERYRSQLIGAQNQLEEETNLFKTVLLAEREDYEQLLEEKEKELEEVLTRLAMLEQNHAKDRREDELLESLEGELRKRQEAIEEERQSMVVWRKQWKEERKQFLAIEAHLRKELAHLRESCKRAKSTAVNYKKYTEEKDKFLNREIERMRMEYEGVIEKLRLKCKRLGAGQGQ